MGGTVNVGPFVVVDASAARVELVQRVVDAIDYPWERLAPLVSADPDGAVIIRWADTGQRMSGEFFGATYEIHLSTQPYHQDPDEVAFTLAHEIGHLVDKATFFDVERYALTDLFHKSSSWAPFGHGHDDPMWAHREMWKDTDAPYAARLFECFADQFVAAFAPTLWEGRFPRFIHWTEDHDAVRRITLERSIPMVAESGTDWALAPCLVALVDECDARAPERSTASDGSIGDSAHAARTSDHNPADGWVTAVDITDDKAGGCDADLLAHLIVARRDPRVKYVIWNNTVVRSYDKPGLPAWTPEPYTGTNPHITHTHISVLNTEAARNDLSPWWGEEDDMASAEVEARFDAIDKRLNEIAAGVMIVAAAVAELDDDIPENAAAIFKELRLNIRRDMQADGVPEGDIVR